MSERAVTKERGREGMRRKREQDREHERERE